MEAVLADHATLIPCGIRTTFPSTSNFDFIGFRTRNHGALSVHSTNNASNEAPDRGTHTTRFHRGFMRVQESSIQADNIRNEYNSMLSAQADNKSSLRRINLRAQNNYNQFNVISGQYELPIKKTSSIHPGVHSHTFDSGFSSTCKQTSMHPHAHTRGGPDDPGENSQYPEINGEQQVVAYREYPGSRLPTHVAKAATTSLAQSRSRFFQPLWTGDKHDRRQTTLVTAGGGPSHKKAAGGGNGRERERVTGIIGTFRSMDTLPSFGIEDQFSKSGYINHASRSFEQFGKEGYQAAPEPFQYNGKKGPGNRNLPASTESLVSTLIGLCDTTRPGAYTPRKLVKRINHQTPSVRTSARSDYNNDIAAVRALATY